MGICEGLLKTYHAIFDEVISDSITQAVIKVQMSAEIRNHLELKTFARATSVVNLMSSLSKMRTAATSSRSAGYDPTPMEIGWVKGKSQGKRKNKEKGKGKGKSKGKGKEKSKSEKFEGWCYNCGVTKLQIVGMENRNRCTKDKVQLVRSA